MKLTMRERIMLIALSFAVLAAASYYLVAMPQLNKIRSMTEERKKSPGGGGKGKS